MLNAQRDYYCFTISFYCRFVFHCSYTEEYIYCLANVYIMDLEDLLSHGILRLGNHRQEDRKDQPSEDHLAFIPNQLNSNVVTLNSTPLNTDGMKMVFIGITTTFYNASMWASDVKRWIEYFRLLLQDCIEIQMLELRDAPGKVDSARAIVEITKALVVLSNVPCGQSIRVICLGPGVTQLTLDTLTYLIREWKTQDNQPRVKEDKKLQVVTTGDNKQMNLFKLCEKLCISSACQSIEFFDTMQYWPFEHYRSSYFLKRDRKSVV